MAMSLSKFTRICEDMLTCVSIDLLAIVTELYGAQYELFASLQPITEAAGSLGTGGTEDDG